MSIAAAAGLQALCDALGTRLQKGVAAVCVGLVSVECLMSAGSLAVGVTTPFAPGLYYFEEGNPALRALGALARTENVNYRFLVRPNELVPPNIGSREPLLSAMGYRSSMLGSYFEFITRAGDLASTAWDQLGVRFVVSNQPVTELTAPVTTQPFGYVRPSALKVLWSLNEREVAPRPVQIHSTAWGTNQVTFEVDVAEPERLVFSQPQYPGWHATVDGEEQPLQQHGIFSAVSVSSAGRHSVHFWYSPRWLLPSLCGPLLTLAVLFYGLQRLRRSAKSTTPHRPSSELKKNRNRICR